MSEKTKSLVYSAIEEYFADRGEMPDVKTIAARLKITCETVTRQVRSLAEDGKLTHKKGQPLTFGAHKINWMTKPLVVARG